MRMLNLGCGSRIHADWINVDSVASVPGIVRHDLRQGIPWPDGSVDVVYHSHILEHFTRSDAERFLRECHRVLKPNGLLRVVVPDLEAIARQYLTMLERSREGNGACESAYEWSLLELYDQAVRTTSGGDVVRFCRTTDVHGKAQVEQRWGRIGRDLLQLAEADRPSGSNHSWFRRAARFAASPRRWRERLLRVALGADYTAFEAGRFRLSGEVHQWMYDSFSLRRLLTACGFTNATVASAATGRLPDWSRFHLDTEPDGSVYKPDSLFMEAIKP
jgi:predicted SAM-dependent methyltransferase